MQIKERHFPEGLDFLEKLDNPDAGCLLLILSATDGMKAERLQMISYILTEEGILPFWAAFRFDPKPYSKEVSSVLSDLEGAEYLARDLVEEPTIRLTDRGKRWIEERNIELELLAEISKEVRRFNSMSNDELFGHAFTLSVLSCQQTL